MVIKGLKNWVLPVYRKHLIDYDSRIEVYYGGGGSGKSHFVVQKVIIKALQDTRKVLVVRKVGTTLKTSVWDLFKETLGKMPQVVQNINKSEMTITLVNGSVFLFKGLDDPEKIKSIHGITDIVIEEATELTKDDFDQLNLRLRSKKAHNQIFLMFNPVSKANWVYKYFFEDRPNNCKIIHTTYRDNKYLPKDYVDSLLEMKVRNPAYYKIYAEGEFATLDKLVFKIFEKRIINIEEMKNLIFWIGLDWGFTNDETAITWGYYDPRDMTLYITGEYNRTGMTNDVIAETLKNLGMAGQRIVADCAEPKSIAELKKYGISHVRPCTKGPDSVRNGIDKLQRCKIIIDERCVHTIEEFENYTWKKDKSSGEYINEPIDAYNHHIDSIRYGTQDVWNKKVYSESELKSHWLL